MLCKLKPIYALLALLFLDSTHSCSSVALIIEKLTYSLERRISILSAEYLGNHCGIILIVHILLLES